MSDDRDLDLVLDEIAGVVSNVNRSEIDDLADELGRSSRVFVAGEGRSGFMAKAFAMRLMHLGLTAFVVGETTTPAVGPNDTLVAVSGSGTTKGTVRAAEQAAAVGAAVHVVTTDPTSELAGLADVVLTVPAATKARRGGEAATIQPLSSLFDQVCHIVLDVACLKLADLRGIDNAAARQTHANTE